MKFPAVTLAALLSAAQASMPEISSHSMLGKNLLSKARRLEDEENENEDEDEEINYEWVANYSVKFQGCHHIRQWNEDANENEDVRIATKRLIRFRLCPSNSCSANKAAGCTSGYGDYVIDMDTFMESWFEAKKQSIEYNCENYLNSACNCNDNDDHDDNFNEEYCEYDCFNDAEMSECIDRNPYNEDEDGQEEEFNLEDYMVCTQLEIPEEDDGDRRKLADDDGGGDGDDDEDAVQYYVGPYCSEQGGAVTLGLFSDDSCTIAETDVSFKDIMGFALPYEDTSIVDAECLECVEKENDENENDEEDADTVSESCEMVYEAAGKCELNYADGLQENGPNTAACNYIEGIRIVRQDGIIDTGSSRPSAVATAFIVIFSMAFATMAFYVWYLRTRLGIKNDSLL